MPAVWSTEYYFVYFVMICECLVQTADCLMLRLYQFNPAACLT